MPKVTAWTCSFLTSWGAKHSKLCGLSPAAVTPTEGHLCSEGGCFS